MSRTQITVEEFNKAVEQDTYHKIYGRTLAGIRWENWGVRYRDQVKLVVEQHVGQPETYWRIG